MARLAADWPPEPYLGINFYTAADAPLFGERDEDIERCAALVGDFSTRLLVLQGKSGTGKSSFLRAGLIPRLEQQGSPFHFLRAEKDSSEPAFVRCTNDPILQIHTLLRHAIEHDPQLTDLPLGYRQAVKQLLESAPMDDRVDTAVAILKILAVLSESMSQTLALVIDQSEEILTLQAAGDPHNRRKAFFYLLEELCLRNLDIRVIIALRTEFCGLFYDAFGMNPSLRVTSSVRAGLEQFMLSTLPPESIVAAILRPTLTTPIPGYGTPRARYRFKYGDGVAEHIAADLIRHCGESSTLPVLQVVCKGLYDKVVVQRRCPKITIAHYEALGGVEGRIDAFIDDVLRGALRETGVESVNTSDLVRWRRVLATLVAQQEGNAVTTLIRGEQDIVQEGYSQGLRGDLPKILKILAKQRWRLLRCVTGGEKGDALRYSLGHDAIAVALLRWDEAQQGAEQAEQERRKARRRLQVYSMAFASVLLFVAGALAWKDYSDTIERNERLIEFSAVDEGENFRLRIQLLLAALSLADGVWGPFIDDAKARDELAKVLALSPILSGEGEAVGIDTDGSKIAVLRNNAVHVIDLEAAEQSEGLAYDFRSMEPLAGFSVMPAIGFVSGMAKPVVYKDGYLYWGSLAAERMQVLDLSSEDLKQSQNLSYSPVDFVSGYVQVIVPNRPSETEHWIKVLRATPLTSDTVSRSSQLSRPVRIDWNGPSYWPVFSTQSNQFAYVGASRKEAIYTGIMLSSLADPANASFLYGLPSNRKTDFDSSVALTFANAGRSIVVRDTAATLRIFPAAQDRRARLIVRTAVIQIPENLTDSVQPRRQTMRPLLAAVKTASEWRFAWLTDRGVAAIRSDADHPKTSAAISDGQLLTGSIGLDEAFKLRFSKDGRYLVLLQRRMRQPMRYLVWDLAMDRSELSKLPDEKLRSKACEAAALDTAGPLLRREEDFIWFNNAARPCPEPSHGEAGN